MEQPRRQQAAACARRPLLALVLSAAALIGALRASTAAFAALASRPASLLSGIATGRPRSSRVLRGATETAEAPPRAPAATLPSELGELSETELEARKARALDIWESLKPDIKNELARYQTFRPDKFDKFMRADSRGLALFELYKPGTPEYAEFFEEHMGPYVLDIAKEKLSEGLAQAGGVILVVGVICAILAYFGTDIIQAITAPFTGFAEQFVELYGF